MVKHTFIRPSIVASTKHARMQLLKYSAGSGGASLDRHSVENSMWLRAVPSTPPGEDAITGDGCGDPYSLADV